MTEKVTRLFCWLGWHKWEYANRRSGPRWCARCPVRHDLTGKGWREL